MRFRVPLAFLAVLSALALSGCVTSNGALVPPAAVSVAPSSVKLVNPAQFERAIQEPGRFTVNVHVPFEGNIAGTDLSLPYDQINAQAARLPQDRSTPLAVYCRTGRMSAIAVTALTALGYTNLVELAGGMDAWTADNRPLSG